ncbi:Pentatricopeptide repeat-containing protein At1g63150 [Durusdinium trenchii]|uniref:Pentatricopeptide repeat-containing protein At1g63150 n=1 Tax=Durusdinium trenchii TaxID=1381693 RepID=A0ABP0JUE5_9DINO
MERSEAAEVDSALVAEGAFGVRVTLLYIASSVRHSEQAWLVPEVDLLLSGNPGNEDAALLVYQLLSEGNTLTRWARRPAEATCVLNGLAKLRRTILALQVLKVMQRAGVEVNVFHYSSAASACEKSGQWMLAVQLLADMKGGNVQPNVFTFGSAVSSCGVAACWVEALALLAMAEAADAVNAFAFSGWLLANLAFPLAPPVSYFIQFCQSCSQVQRDAVCISSAISACEKRARWQAAIHLLQSMQEGWTRPNLVAENAALSACEKARRWQHAFALFRELPRKRLKADKISYNAMISACANSGHWELALMLLEELLRMKQPDVMTSDSLACR